ncbi:MAG: biopolymer transporter ExbD [Campylobacterales bacterium]|nr:biopolymer transporter ExbD [Campylobacterales bacterium]
MFDWDDNPDLNITPLVDVMLVLMAILMITAPTIHFEEQIKLPQGSQSTQVSKAKPLDIKINKDGIIYLNNEEFSKLDDFANHFVLKSADFKKDTYISIAADEAIDYGSVIKVLSQIKKQGFLKVSLITE